VVEGISGLLMLHVLVFLVAAVSPPASASDVDNWIADRAAKACEGDEDVETCRILARRRGG
jgi:hypothetical protein